MELMWAVSICVIFNPHAGRRRARRRLAAFHDRWRGRAAFWPTEYAGHGAELGQRAAESHFSVVAAAGGDGTVHDVANGLLASGRRDVTLAVVPIGSANDYAWSLRGESGVSQLDDAAGTWADVGQVESSGGRRRFFVEGLGMGLCGLVTLESRRIRHLQGPWLYGLAAWRALRRDALGELELQWDEQPPEVLPTLTLSVLLGRREGNFLMAPAASLQDGQFDYVHAGRVGRWEVARMLPRICWFGPPTSHPQVRLGRCRRLRAVAAHPLTIHLDGEMYSTPEDGVRDIDVQLLPARLRAKVCPP